METIILNWVILFAVLALFLGALYLVIKLAVKSAVREIGQDLANKLWAEEKKSAPAAPAEAPVSSETPAKEG